MAIELKVPPVGESITSVEIGQWLKAEGDAVAKDESVAVIDSEKATVEVPAPVSGRLVKILKRQGESAPIGEIIAEIDEHGAAASPPRVVAPSAKSAPEPQQRPAAP